MPQYFRFSPSSASVFRIILLRVFAVPFHILEKNGCECAEDVINYKAHIPAGVLFTAVAAFIAGLPAVIPFLIGGALGGALPDIDIEGSAVQKMGSKAVGGAGRVANKVTKGRARAVGGITKAIGMAIDKIILTPICSAWRWLAKNVFGRMYSAIYSLGSANGGRPFGERLHWDSSDPSSHRGGITHSFAFLVGSCIITVPIALLTNSFAFWAGCEVGILSHLVADAMCRSGVKFFWPFMVPIGFAHPNGGKVGNGIRILPPQLQVVTGAANKSSQEIDNMANETEAANARRLRRREIMWQWIFKLLALAFIVMLFVGVGPAPGGFAWTFDGTAEQIPVQTEVSQPASESESQQDQNANANQNVASQDNQDNQVAQPASAASYSGNIAEEGGSVAGVNPLGQVRSETGSVPETAGPRSLTNGDVSLKNLPRGVYKTPDEKLWIIGVGEVNEANLENPRWVFTEEEKKALLRAVSAQRSEGIPESASQFAQNLANGAANVAREGSEAANEAANATSEGVGGIMEWLREITGLGGGSGAYDGGFLGITPYTK